jgi:predicted transcriptional regulator
MSLFDMVFGCSHKRCSFPMSTRNAKRRSPAASVTGTYVVCLDCGKEFPYDWKAMKVIRNRETQPETISPVVAGPKAA